MNNHELLQLIAILLCLHSQPIAACAADDLTSVRMMKLSRVQVTRDKVPLYQCYESEIVE